MGRLLWFGVKKLVGASNCGPPFFPEEMDAAPQLIQSMRLAFLISFGDSDGAPSHSLFPGGRRGASLHARGRQGRHRTAASQPADQGSGYRERNSAVPPLRSRIGAYRGM